MPHEDTRIVRGRHAPEKRELAREFRAESTPTERILWAQLRGGRLRGLHFRQQQVIAGFIVDFYCHGKKLVVEVDGSVHENQRPYDTERDRILIGLGLRILRVSATDVEQRLPLTLSKIYSAAIGIDFDD